MSALDVPVDMIDVSQVEQGSPVELEIKRSGVQIYHLNQEARDA